MFILGVIIFVIFGSLFFQCVLNNEIRNYDYFTARRLEYERRDKISAKYFKRKDPVIEKLQGKIQLLDENDPKVRRYHDKIDMIYNRRPWYY